ncbi:hypothetical protein IJ768_03455 [Candidatus Saccharibacteria bacterium]|nr:hypothetical protein [Candidatus Saccharibacteria bacterium]
MALLYIFAVLILIETTFLVFKATRKNESRSGKRKIYVDTSALMDGRILSIAKTGFIGDDLFIPRSAIRELQLLADGKDSEKRVRARFGMETANELERIVFCNTEIFEDALDRTPVDERLIQLAKANKGLIFTCDFNLQKVAETEKIEVLNPNELASELRSEFMPGDKFKLKISAEGQNPKQGIGYLPEGTMVVVDNAASNVGTEIEVEFQKYIQTNSGRMMFAKKVAHRQTTTHSPRVSRQSKVQKNQRQTGSRGRGSRK